MPAIQISGIERTSAVLPRRAIQVTCRCQSNVAVVSSNKKPQYTPSSATIFTAASILPLNALTTLPALAEDVETVQTTTSILGFTPTGLALAFSPLVVYGLFFLYREKVNPRATFADLLFIIAAVVIIGNIFSILVFKQRIY